jgi:hypothetical protein
VKSAASISQGLRKALGDNLQIRIALVGEAVFMERRTPEQITLAETKRELRKEKATLGVVKDILDAAGA